MKNIIISADCDRMVYSVPDKVADNLTNYCLDFCDKWLHTSPNAKKYRKKGGFCYDEREYLNTYIFSEEEGERVVDIATVLKIFNPVLEKEI